MGFLSKLLGKKDDHEAWLKAHPGKDSKNSPPPDVSVEEEQGTRDRMEAEMAAQKTRREGS